MPRRKTPEETNWVALIVLLVFGVIAAIIAMSGAGGGGSSPVHVRGYHRSDGTYVAPHDRARPRR